MPRRTAFNGQPPWGGIRINPASPQAQNLIGWWPFGESVPNLALHDLSPLRHNSTSTGANFVRGWHPMVGRSWGFDGSSSWYQFGNVLAGLTNITIAVWFHGFTNDVADDSIFVNKHAEYRLCVDSASGKLNWLPGTGNVLGTTVIDAGAHLAVVTYDKTANVDTLYLDAQVENTGATGGPGVATTNPFEIGEDSVFSIGFPQVNLVDIRLYNRALSAADVWRLYDPLTRWDLYAAFRQGPWPFFPFVPPGLGPVVAEQSPQIVADQVSLFT